MKGTDLNMQDELWECRPEQHRTAHHGHERFIVLGKQAQEVLAPFLRTNLIEYQIRHTAGTEFRKRFGLEVAQVLLGHKTLTVTQVYAEKNIEAARKVMVEVG